MRLDVGGTDNPEQLARIVLEYSGKDTLERLRAGTFTKHEIHEAVRRWAASVVDAACHHVGVFARVVGPSDRRSSEATEAPLPATLARAVLGHLDHLHRHTPVLVEWRSVWRRGVRREGHMEVEPACEVGISLGVSPRTDAILQVDPDLFPY